MEVTSWYETGYAIGAAIFGVLSGAGALFFRWYNKMRTRNRYDLSRSHGIDEQINNLLEELRARLGAERVLLLRFHNGGNYFDGTPIKRFSCTGEAAAPGASHEILTYQTVPVSLAWELITWMIRNCTSVNKTEDMKPGFMRSRMLDIGIPYYLVAPLHIDDLPVAALLVHFKHLPCISDSALCKFRDAEAPPNGGRCEQCGMVRYYMSQMELRLGQLTRL